MNIVIANVTLKLVPENLKYFPKNVRSFPLEVVIDGTPGGEFRLTTGVGRDGEKRRYAHVMVGGKAFWAKLSDDVVLVDPEARIVKPAVAEVPAEEVPEEA
jgi:hypothetical protein